MQAEFEQSIIEDLALLGIKADATSYTSDYFDTLQQMAVQLIKDGKAYADDTEQEKVRVLCAERALLLVGDVLFGGVRGSGGHPTAAAAAAHDWQPKKMSCRG